MLMVSNTPLGKKAVFSLPRNNLHDTCQDITFPPGHTLIDYPGAQNKDSNTKCLLQKKKKKKGTMHIIQLFCSCSYIQRRQKL